MPLVFLLLLSGFSWSADLFVKSLKAPVLSEPKNGSNQLANLDRGAKIEGLGPNGVFMEVKTAGGKGYINRMFLSDKPVDTKASLLNQDIDISSKARKRASGFTSAAAARGLKEDSDDIFKSLGDADPAAIKKMESFKVDEQVGLNFLHNKSQKVMVK